MKDFVKKWSRYFIFAGIFSLGINILALTFSVYMLAIYDRVLSSYSMPTLYTITFAAMLALIVQSVLEYLRSGLLILAGVDIDKTISHTVLGEMLKDSCSINKTGYSGGLRDVNILRNYMGGNPIFALFDIPWVPIFLIFIFMVHPIMGMVAIGGAVSSVILGVWQEIATRKRLELANNLSGTANSFTGLALRNCETVRAMGMLGGIETRWKGYNDQVIELQTVASRSAGILQAIARLIRTSLQVIIYGVGAWLVLKNECTPGVMIASSIIMGRALAPIDQGMATWKQTIEARAAYNRLNDLIKNAKKANHMLLPDPVGKLDVEGATIAANGRYLLNNVIFSLEPGEMLGLIGPNGAGKTTLSRLLLGIWPSMGGKVRLDGSDVFEWDQEHLGKFIGYLPQDVELFPGTISQNIARLGEIDSDEVIKAAKKAGIHDLILHYPAGYDTLIGMPGGIVLSGGQRQRVALARALYGNPRLIVMDEPNSNLDDAGEAALMQTLAILKQERVTTVIITHKISFLAIVDKILFLQNGMVAKFGRREEFFQQAVNVAAPVVQANVNKSEVVS